MAHDPEYIFRTAELFRRASHNLMTHEIDMGLPSAVCGAFSAELYLKCLILIEKSALPREHDLRKLFDRLKPESQNVIRTCLNTTMSELFDKYHRPSHIQMLFMDFDEPLNASRSAFKLFRYAYELKPSADSPISWRGGIAEAIRLRIIELRPAWNG